MTAPSAALSPPADWHAEAHHLWLAEQQTEALQVMVDALNATIPNEPRGLVMQFAYYRFLMGHYGAAAEVLERQVARAPDDTEALLNAAVALKRMGRNAESVTRFEAVVQREPDNAVAWDGLAAAYAQLKDYARAAEAGTRALTLKDAKTAHIQGAGLELHLPERSPPGRGVISFSLFGAGPRYLRGALRNALLVEDIYPGWCCRFHVDGSVPLELVEALASLGAELVRERDGAQLQEKLAWRFKAAEDPAVERFLIRDVDSVIGLREAAAVQLWIDSGRAFHVMRDWWSHTDPILAGMWGGVGGALPGVFGRACAYRPAVMTTPNVDQWFLRDEVWPLIRKHVLAHDRCFRALDAAPFPGEPPARNAHVGQDEYAVARERQDTLLAPWIERLPCLRRT